MANIEQRGNTWYATLHVPKDVSAKLGTSKFLKSLQTTDKRVAETRAKPLIAQWKAQIANARGRSDPFLEDALQWRKEYVSNPNPCAVRDAIEEEAIKVAEKSNADKGALFYAVATGTKTPLEPLYTEWAAQLSYEPKTNDQMKKDVRLMVDHFKALEEITSANVREWLKELMTTTPTKKGVTPSSIERIIKFSRNFWRYLQEYEKADPERTPFTVPSFAKPQSTKSKSNNGWTPFTPAEVVQLLEEASKNDGALADLIRLGMYSGARIEELCALKAKDCTDDALSITDAKTDAGIRVVPVHSALVDVVKRLKESSSDGYLLSGLTFNKYGDRSNAIGKRFGRLKAKLGYSDKKVFHSIRKTVVTMLENAGVSENLTADIVGHEKPRITYGLYSGGHSLENMKAAIEKLRYE